MEFNDGQKAGIEALGAFLDSEDQFEFCLGGFAGTGKTTVIQHVFDSFDGRVLFTAPTHKAVGVLADMARERGIGYPVETIHRGLSLKKSWNKDTGATEFIPDPKRVPMVESYDVLVVDECSMIGSELYGLVKPYIDSQRVKVIWMGDPLQLPPVGDEEERSRSFEAPAGHTLTEVMRNGGVIAETVSRVRSNIDSVDPVCARSAQDDRGEIEVMGSRLWVRRFLDEVSSNPESTNTQALAFTNKSVDWINAHARKEMFGADAAPYVAGERLVAVETFEQDGQIVFYTGATFAVNDAWQTEEQGFGCWELEIEASRYGSTFKELILALDESQKPAVAKELKKRKEAAIKDRTKWGEYFRLKEMFANVRPGYAATVHKSQGSTYDKVYLAQTDVLRNAQFDHVLRNKLLYVGYSRTRSGLYIA